MSARLDRPALYQTAADRANARCAVAHLRQQAVNKRWTAGALAFHGIEPLATRVGNAAADHDREADEIERGLSAAHGGIK